MRKIKLKLDVRVWRFWPVFEMKSGTPLTLCSFLRGIIINKKDFFYFNISLPQRIFRKFSSFRTLLNILMGTGYGMDIFELDFCSKLIRRDGFNILKKNESTKKKLKVFVAGSSYADQKFWWYVWLSRIDFQSKPLFVFFLW